MCKSQDGLVSPGVPSESAVEAFWKSFSPQSTTPSPPRSKVVTLPVELLLIIFKLVREQDALGRRLGSQSNTLSSSHFPHAIAAVCSLWRDAMSMIPEVWTQFVIVVSSAPAIPPSAFLSQLSWTRDLPLDVTITRSDFDHPVDSQHERTQVISIMNTLINPHIHRIRVLHFDLMFSSSLPLFPDAFRGTARLLDGLYLECKEDNGYVADDWELFTSMEQQFPELASLVVDGRNYYHACQRGSCFAAKSKKVRYLAISHYQPRQGELFLTSDFLRQITMMKELRRLHMTDLVLEPSPLPLPTPTTPIFLLELRLQAIRKSQSLTEIFDGFTDVSRITITRSTIGDVKPFRSDVLTLENIDANQDIVPLLRSWEGNRLSVIGCPSFNDAVLHMMAPREDGVRTCASGLIRLSITDCPNISVAALKRFVALKWEAGHGIQILGVYGDGLVIRDEDIDWLSET